MDPLQHKLDALVARITALERQMAALGLRMAEGFTRSAVRPRVAAIQRIVAAHYSLLPAVMRSPRRTDAMARPRQLAMALCRELTNYSLNEIGLCFGGRDHGTVIFACKAVENRCSTDVTYAAEVAGIRAQCEWALRQMVPGEKVA
jgi:chromosomal replication initiation ATPase DnaA